MTDTDTTEVAARNLQRRIDRQLVPFRARLRRLHPVDAMAILGNLTGEAFNRIPPAQRMAAATNWCDAITAGVRQSLG